MHFYFVFLYTCLFFKYKVVFTVCIFEAFLAAASNAVLQHPLYNSHLDIYICYLFIYITTYLLFMF